MSTFVKQHLQHIQSSCTEASYSKWLVQSGIQPNQVRKTFCTIQVQVLGTFKKIVQVYLRHVSGRTLEEHYLCPLKDLGPLDSVMKVIYCMALPHIVT